MTLEAELTRQLNLLDASPAFVMRENSKSGRLELKSLSEVPDGDGVYWVAATCRLKNSLELPAVIRVDTNAGGSLQAVFWKIHGVWFDHADPAGLHSMGITPKEAFPFDWKYRVPLHRDLYHD